MASDRRVTRSRVRNNLNPTPLFSLDDRSQPHPSIYQHLGLQAPQPRQTRARRAAVSRPAANQPPARQPSTPPVAQGPSHSPSPPLALPSLRPGHQGNQALPAASSQEPATSPVQPQGPLRHVGRSDAPSPEPREPTPPSPEPREPTPPSPEPREPTPPSPEPRPPTPPNLQPGQISPSFTFSSSPRVKQESESPVSPKTIKQERNSSEPAPVIKTSGSSDRARTVTPLPNPEGEQWVHSPSQYDNAPPAATASTSAAAGGNASGPIVLDEDVEGSPAGAVTPLPNPEGEPWVHSPSQYDELYAASPPRSTGPGGNASGPIVVDEDDEGSPVRAVTPLPNPEGVPWVNSPSQYDEQYAAPLSQGNPGPTSAGFGGNASGPVVLDEDDENSPPRAVTPLPNPEGVPWVDSPSQYDEQYATPPSHGNAAPTSAGVGGNASDPMVVDEDDENSPVRAVTPLPNPEGEPWVYSPSSPPNLAPNPGPVGFSTPLAGAGNASDLIDLEESNVPGSQASGGQSSTISAIDATLHYGSPTHPELEGNSTVFGQPPRSQADESETHEDSSSDEESDSEDDVMDGGNGPNRDDDDEAGASGGNAGASGGNEGGDGNGDSDGDAAMSEPDEPGHESQQRSERLLLEDPEHVGELPEERTRRLAQGLAAMFGRPTSKPGSNSPPRDSASEDSFGALEGDEEAEDESSEQAYACRVGVEGVARKSRKRLRDGDEEMDVESYAAEWRTRKARRRIEEQCCR